MSTVPQNVNFDVGGLLKGAWEIFSKDIVNWLLVTVVGILALGCGAWGGWHYCALKSARGESISVGDVLYPWSNLGLLIPVLIMIGVAIPTCGLGMIVLAVLWFWLYPLMVDRGMGWSEAGKLSKDTVMANLGPSLIILVVGMAINMVGSFIPFGGLVTTPFVYIFTILAYLQLFGTPATPQQLDYAPGMPATAPPAAAPPAAAPFDGGPAASAPPAAAPPATAPPDSSPPAAAPPAAAPPADALPATTFPAADEPVPPTATAIEPDEGPTETAQQATTDDPDEIVLGKTIVMSSVDFEAMLKGDKE